MISLKSDRLPGELFQSAESSCLLKYLLHLRGQLENEFCIICAARFHFYGRLEYLLGCDGIRPRSGSGRSVFDRRIDIGRKDRDGIIAVIDDLEDPELLRELPQ